MVLVAAAPFAAAGTHYVVKGDHGPRASAVSWQFVPSDYMMWQGLIINHGLKSLVVEVCDITTGVEEEMSHEVVRFADLGAYPNGTVVTSGVTMAPSHVYMITVIPNGPKGSWCEVEDPFVLENPVASFEYSVDGMTVSVNASASTGNGPLTYVWDWGDGTTGSGVTASHTYSASSSATSVSSRSSPDQRQPIEYPMIFGYTTTADGIMFPGCEVTITNLRTGDSVVTYSDLEYGWYQLMYQLPYVQGDTMNVTATNGPSIGWNEGEISLPYLQLDIHLNGPVPIVKNISLTVTDSLGMSVSVTRTVALNP